MTSRVGPGTVQEQCSLCQVAQGDCTVSMARENCMVSMACGGCTVRMAHNGVQLIHVPPAVHKLAEHIFKQTSLFAIDTLQCCVRYAEH